MTITPSIIQQGSQWTDAPERFELFTIVDTGGKSTRYSMPRAKHPGIVLEYLQVARKQGEELASSWLLEKVLGAAGYSALVNEPGLTFEAVNSITRAALQVLTGRAPAADVATPGPDDEGGAVPFE